MNCTIKKQLLTLTLLACGATTASADVKVKMNTSAGGASSESVVYIKGKRQRSEQGAGMVSITQCDLKRDVRLNTMTKTYTVSPFDNPANTASPASADSARTNRTPAKRGGIITSTITTKDTGERKQMFGFTARRIKTSMVTESSPEACNQSKSRMEIDGWYIDFAADFACEAQTAGIMQRAMNGGDCQDQYRTKQIGAARTGYAVQQTMTFYDEAGKASTGYTQEVVELSKTPLDPALFDVPTGYREVKDASEMYGAAAMMRAANEDAEGETSGASSSLLKNNSSAAKPVNESALGAKKEGVVRVGVALPKATAAGEGISPHALAEAVRNTMVSYLKGPAIEVVALEARLPQQLGAEAKQKECDYVVLATVTHKKGKSGGFGGFLKGAAIVADAAPIGYGSTGAAVAASVATTAVYTAAEVSTSVKAKDELTLDYKMQSPATGAAVVAQTLKAKAKSDGDDLITQLVEQAAGAVLAGATKK